MQRTLLVAALAFPVLAAPSAAQCQLDKLFAPDPDVEDEFGIAVAIEGNVAIVGAGEDDEAAINAGAAYVLARGPDGWSVSQKLFPIAASAGDEFGLAIDVDGDLAVVGAYADFFPGVGAYSGSAHLFEKTPAGWQPLLELHASDPTSIARFGRAVTLDGGTLAVGAPHAFGDSFQSGAVYVFDEGLGWAETAKLFAVDLSTPYNDFGRSVGLEGDTLLVGDPYAVNRGAVYAYERIGGAWTLVDTLVPEGVPVPVFGWSLSLDGDRVLIGAKGTSIDVGAAYVFERTGDGTWDQTARLDPSDAGPGDEVGQNVSLRGDVALVGAWRHTHDPDEPKSGAAYVFERTADGTWEETAELLPDDFDNLDAFAYGLALGPEGALVGAVREDEMATNAGALYEFLLGPRFVPYGSGLAGTGGLVPRLTSAGCPSPGLITQLLIDGGLAGAPGCLVVGIAPGAVPYGGGTLLVLGALFEIIHTLDPAGEATLLLAVPPDPALKGVSIYLQSGYLDPGAPVGVSLTGGLRMEID